jgi:hypothetical protein
MEDGVCPPLLRVAYLHHPICDDTRTGQRQGQATAVEIDEFVDAQRRFELLAPAFGVYDVIFVQRHFASIV